MTGVLDVLDRQRQRQTTALAACELPSLCSKFQPRTYLLVNNNNTNTNSDDCHYYCLHLTESPEQ